MRDAWAPALLGIAAVLSGCFGGGGGGGPGTGPDGVGPEGPLAAQTVNYTLGAEPLPPYRRSYEDTLLPQDWENYPVAPDPTCCAYWRMDVPDLLPAGQVAQVRITLNWTNEAQNQADLDIAPCIPYYCGYIGGADQSAATGPQSESGVLVTRGAEGDETMRLGVRYHNAALTTGLAYTLDVEVVPLERALPAYRPYAFQLPENATLRFELMAPLGPSLGAEGASSQVVVYGLDDRPAAHGSLEGAEGSSVSFDLPAGRHVVVVQSGLFGALRMRAEAVAAEVSPELAPLPTTYDVLEVAALADPSQEAEGTVRQATPPGIIDVIPWFEFTEGGIAAQNDLGLGVAEGGFFATVASSTGTLYDVEIRESSVDLEPQGIGHNCVSCRRTVAYDASAILDDDGTYEMEYRADRAMGRVMLYLYRYTP